MIITVITTIPFFNELKDKYHLFSKVALYKDKIIPTKVRFQGCSETSTLLWLMLDVYRSYAGNRKTPNVNSNET